MGEGVDPGFFLFHPKKCFLGQGTGREERLWKTRIDLRRKKGGLSQEQEIMDRKQELRGL